MLTSFKTLKRARSWLRWDLILVSAVILTFFLNIYHRDINYRMRWAGNINPIKCCNFINLNLSVLIFNLLQNSKLIKLLLSISFELKFSLCNMCILLYHFCLLVGWDSCCQWRTQGDAQDARASPCPPPLCIPPLLPSLKGWLWEKMRQWATRKKCKFVYLRLENFLLRIIIYKKTVF